MSSPGLSTFSGCAEFYLHIIINYARTTMVSVSFGHLGLRVQEECPR